MDWQFRKIEDSQDWQRFEYIDMKQFVKKIHMVGIGGAGMCPLAEVLHAHGHRITGSDKISSPATSRLESLGIKIQLNHTPDLVRDADLLVYSSAVKQENPERVYAREHGIHEMRRAEVLGELMRAHFTVCISGTHGKTTTTSLVGEVFNDAGLKPTVLVGGMLRSADSHAVVGKGNLMVAEADEYDRSFLAMYPSLAIITNIEADHLDCYGSLQSIKEAFLRFTERIPFYGAVIVCSDDEGVRDILPSIQRTVITYGLNSSADYTAEDISFSRSSTSFTVKRKGEICGAVNLNLPGIHNVLNSLAVIAAATEMGIEFGSIVSTLSAFQGVRRRFEIIAEAAGVTVIDDYAHHPAEIRATLDAARRSGYKRIVAVFQPHLYSRTRDLMEEFVRSLLGADLVFVTDIYKAREEAIPGVTSGTIVEKMAEIGHLQATYVACKEDVVDRLKNLVQEGDAVIMMGAGDIRDCAVKFAGEIANG